MQRHCNLDREKTYIARHSKYYIISKHGQVILLRYVRKPVPSSILFLQKNWKQHKMNKQFLAFGDNVDDSENCSKEYQLRLIGLHESRKLGSRPILERYTTNDIPANTPGLFIFFGLFCFSQINVYIGCYIPSSHWDFFLE